MAILLQLKAEYKKLTGEDPPGTAAPSKKKEKKKQEQPASGGGDRAKPDRKSEEKTKGIYPLIINLIIKFQLLKIL